jgi:hypothetical protein
MGGVWVVPATFRLVTGGSKRLLICLAGPELVGEREQAGQVLEH